MNIYNNSGDLDGISTHRLGPQLLAVWEGLGGMDLLESCVTG